MGTDWLPQLGRAATGMSEEAHLPGQISAPPAPKAGSWPSDFVLPGPLFETPSTWSPISLPPTQSSLAIPLDGGLQLQAVNSLPTIIVAPGMGRGNRRMRKLKGKKVEWRAGPTQFLKCSPTVPKTPRPNEGRESFCQAWASEMPFSPADLLGQMTCVPVYFRVGRIPLQPHVQGGKVPVQRELSSESP